jgi:hypothetical protein
VVSPLSFSDFEAAVVSESEAASLGPLSERLVGRRDGLPRRQVRLVVGRLASAIGECVVVFLNARCAHGSPLIDFPIIAGARIVRVGAACAIRVRVERTLPEIAAGLLVRGWRHGMALALRPDSEPVACRDGMVQRRRDQGSEMLMLRLRTWDADSSRRCRSGADHRRHSV